MVTTLSDYTQLGKDYVARGQKQSLWEEFLTGTQSYFQQQTQQAQNVYSYDISQAYANYKKQQLQLQMNEQLGAGFQQQVGTELQTAYGQTYQDIKTQEASTLAKIAEQEATELEKGEAEFEELGATLQQVGGLYEDFAAEAGIRKPKESEMYTISKDAQGNQTYELTDIGRLWYYNVQQASVNGQTFDDWLAADEDRLALADFMKQRPDLVAGTITGLTKTATGDYDFDIESAQAKWSDIQYNTPTYSSGIKPIGESSAMNDNAGDNFKLEYNGKSYKVEKGKDADPALKTKLTDEYRDSYGGDPSFGDTMIYQGQVYMYLYNNNRNSWEWNAIRGRKNDKSGYNNLLNDLGITAYQQQAGKPSTKNIEKPNKASETIKQTQQSMSKGRFSYIKDIFK
jgi:hypothetical protein